MKLEDQIEKLKTLGISLNKDVTIDDILYSFERHEYENRPFDLILFVFGIEIEREPWNRYFSKDVWNFDMKSITSTGAYVSIINKFCELSGNPNALTNITDMIDSQSQKAWVKYDFGEIRRKWEIEFNDKWADMLVTSYILNDLETSENSFYYKDNGDAMIIIYLDRKSANELNTLTNNSLKLINVL